MNNTDFSNVILEAFINYLDTGARSNKKLKILHSQIANDISERLNNDSYKLFSLGYENGKEQIIKGRYLDKKVDITIKKDNEVVAGIAVKFVMSNYSQNSVNYFENMLGETANIRSANIPYFQIFVIFDEVPYFGQIKDMKGTRVKKWEHISPHNIDKYIKLSQDNTNDFFHTPNKTFVSVLTLEGIDRKIGITKEEYIEQCKQSKLSIKYSNQVFSFGKNVIYNDYNQFTEKLTHYILSI